MKRAVFRKLVYYQSFHLAWAEDDCVCLRVKKIYPSVADFEHTACVLFHIVEIASGEIAGELSLRIGEDPSLFYLGHIGYHIDPPYQGQHFAGRACALCVPLLRQLGMRSVVITTDEDNHASIRTCEALGAVFECSVNVPLWCMRKFEISHRKRRYVLWTA